MHPAIGSLQEEVGGRGLVLRAGVDHLTDERYWELSSFEALRVGIERTYRFTA